MIKKVYNIGTSIDKVWKGLTNQKEIEGWGAGPAKISPIKGECFSLWGGDIFGKNIDAQNNKILKQEWFGGNWDKPSIVTFELTSIDKKHTKLVLKQTDVPKNEIKDIDNGWDEFYLGPLKDYLEGKS